MLWQYVSADSNVSKVQPSNSLGIENLEYFLHPGSYHPNPGSADHADAIVDPRFRTTKQLQQLQASCINDSYMGQMNEPTINNNYVTMEKTNEF